MDALLYFLSHSFVYNLLLGLAFFALGLGFGWWFWARWQSRAQELELQGRRLQTDLMRLRAETEPLRGRAEESAAALETLRGENAALRAQVAELTAKNGAVQLESDALSRQITTVRALGVDSLARAAELELQAVAAEKRAAELIEELGIVRSALDAARQGAS